MVNQDLCHAVGEAGLDYSEGFPSVDEQQDWFNYQVSLAVEVNKPLFLHERDAHIDFLKTLDAAGFNGENNGASNPVDAIVHCFTGNINELQVYVDRGFYIGLTGHVIHRLEKPELVDWMKVVPIDKLLLETDAPYMGFKGCRATEVKKKGSRYPNVPAALPQIVKYVAEAADVPAPTLASTCLRNAARLFPRAKFL